MIRVLLIDGHPLLRGSLLRTIQSIPDLRAVGDVDSIALAHEWLRDHTTDLLVLGTGLAAATQAVRSLLDGRADRRVVVVTRHQDPQMLEAIVSAGALGVLGTGATPADFERACREAAGGQSFVAPAQSADRSESAAPLTRRESEVLRCVAEGGTTKSIGEVLEISAKTVDTHRQNIMRKLNLRTVAELTKHAVRIGVTSL